MIAIYAKAGDTRATELCAALRERSVPCGMVGPEYGLASMIHKVPFLFIGAGCEAMIDSFHNTIPDYKIIRSYDMLCPERLAEHLRKVYGLDFFHLSGGGIRFVEDQLYFFGNRISLTDCEKSILKLLLLCRGTYFTADEIAAFCLHGNSISSVAVHIHNINAKNVVSGTERIVYSKRYCGYRIK